jgi:hypothetical protein
MPYSGAVKAVRIPTGTLFGRTLLGIRTRLRVAVVTAARTTPSVHQLLPPYQCVTDHASGTRLDAVPLPLPDLGSAMVDDAFAFRRELDEAVRRNTEADRLGGRPAAHWVCASGGKGEPTDVALSVIGGAVAYVDHFQDNDRWLGAAPCRVWPRRPSGETAPGATGLGDRGVRGPRPPPGAPSRLSGQRGDH